MDSNTAVHRRLPAMRGSENNMSNHTIHGHTVSIDVYQGNLSPEAKGKVIGKIVNMCREMSAERFSLLNDYAPNTLVLSPEGAKVLEEIDRAIGEYHTKGYPPIASIRFK